MPPPPTHIDFIILPEPRRRHSKVEPDEQSARLKVLKEMENRTHGDLEHTFMCVEVLDDFSVIVWAQNSNNATGKTIFSRAYTIHQPWVVE